MSEYTWPVMTANKDFQAMALSVKCGLIPILGLVVTTQSHRLMHTTHSYINLAIPVVKLSSLRTALQVITSWAGASCTILFASVSAPA